MYGSSPKAYKILQSLNLKIVDLVPSLFTFNIQHHLLDGFMGTTFPQAVVKIPQLKAEESGPLLIAHWGLSRPAILKLSVYGVRELAQLNYHFEITVNFIGVAQETARAQFDEFKEHHPNKTI